MRVFPVPPGQTRFYQLSIYMGTIQERHIANGPPVPVGAKGCDSDFLSEDQANCELCSLVAESLSFLRTVNAIETHVFCFAFVHHRYRVTVCNSYNLPGELVRRECVRYLRVPSLCTRKHLRL